MTEKEMIKQSQKPESLSEEEVAVKLATFLADLAEMFGEGAAMLSRLSDCFKEDREPRDLETPGVSDEDEAGIGHMEATVLYAVPGAPVRLMTEEDALSMFPGFEEEQTFHCFEILEHLYLYYMEYAWESEEDLTITAPVFVARVNDDETENVELTARDFVAAIAFLNDHTVTLADETGHIGCGYQLPKED